MIKFVSISFIKLINNLKIRMLISMCHIISTFSKFKQKIYRYIL